MIGALLTLLLAAPRVLAPGAVAQTTRPQARLFAQGKEPLSVTVNGVPATCLTGGARESVAHCTLALEPGENRVVVKDPSGETALLLRRYVTTGPLVPGVDTAGFGPGTLHRTAVEAQCAPCHRMDDATGKAPDTRLDGSPCVRCHREIVERKRQHGPVGQAACLMCHDPSTSPQRYQVKWPIQETCFGCHKDIEGQMTRKAFRHGPAAAGRCTTCHDPHGSDNEFWLKKPVWELCTNCHTEKALDRHVVVGFVFGDSHPTRGRTHPLKPAEFYCSSCHNPHAAQYRFLWQFDATSREQLCEKCHAK